ncbi:glycosyltransferase family 2 protein [Candidatus Woesearchaeota archaeon]|nr:glycosyltransferase family 2 protein [Candidatus Woesearchaeota archaeon]
MNIVITLPAYNEEKDIGNVLKEIKEVMDSTRYKYKILVVNDGSKDNTAKIARENGSIVVSNSRNLGLAETFKREMEECTKFKADIIIHTDADGQYPAHYIPEMIKKVEEGYNLVLGARFGRGNYQGSLMKRVGNIAFAKVFSGLLKTKITDTTTGFRAFTSEVAKLPLINTFTYTQEQLIRAGKAKMKVAEIPISTRKTRESRLFKNSFDYAIKAWINIFRIYRDFEPLRFFGVFGSIFIFVGMLNSLFLAYTFIATGRVGHIPLTIVTALLYIVGVQIILFGFLADMKK